MHKSDKMCVLCFNSQWRSVLIGAASAASTLIALFVTLAYHDAIGLQLEAKLAKASDCSGSSYENECAFLALSTIYPWPLWTVLSFYIILNVNLVLSAVYK